MDCEELIELFEKKVGGVLNCDYNRGTIIVKNTKLECKIQTKDYSKLEKLMFDYSTCGDSLVNLKNDNMSMKECIVSQIKLSNYYLDNNEYGFEITRLDKFHNN
jgi:glutathione peroxidase-family protein